MRFEVARPTFEGAEQVWKWRLDPEVMKNSLTFNQPIALEVFFPLFISTHFTIPALPPLYPLKEGKRLGIIRFNPAPGNKCVEISIVLDSEERGQGIGTEVLIAASQFVKEQRFNSIIAKIKPGNIASKKAFEKAGYTLHQQETDILEYRLQLWPESSSSVFIIAEVGSNWTSADPEMLINKAAEAGADAVKFQVFRSETTYAPNAGVADYLDQDIESLFKQLEMPYEKIAFLANCCEKAGVEFMATPFSLNDFTAIDPFVKRHKIASYENNHIPLLRAAASSLKPIILSTGATTLEEIAFSFNYLKMMGAEDLTLLQCLAKYPAPENEMNLRVLTQFINKFHCPVGLSDHTSHPFSAPLAAVALGATVIEKHYTLDRTLPGPDHSFAIIPNELKELVMQIRSIEKLLGTEYKKIEPSEEELRLFARRGLQAVLPIKKGELLKRGVNFEILRPGKNLQGAHPEFADRYEGIEAVKNYRAGEGILQ